jgi:hypothetical protein
MFDQFTRTSINFNNNIGYNLIFNFSTTSSDCGLLTEALRNKSMIKKNVITIVRASIISWTCPINIWKGLNMSMLPQVRTRPWFVVCLRYHGIILTILQWSVIVECMNWQADLAYNIRDLYVCNSLGIYR